MGLVPLFGVGILGESVEVAEWWMFGPTESVDCMTKNGCCYMQGRESHSSIKAVSLHMCFRLCDRFSIVP